MSVSNKIDFRTMIQKDRDERNRKHFEGTFLDYLEIVKENPVIAQLAHGRLHKVITDPGVRVEHPEDNARMRRLRRHDTIRKYAFFENEFFGMDRVVNQIVRYFNSASMGGEESRQVLYLVGPVGAGKYSLMEKL